MIKLVIALICVCLVIIYCQKPTTSHESFSNTTGMLVGQRKYYAKCISECDRRGDRIFGTTQLLCDRACANAAEQRMRDGLPDITDGSFQKNYSMCAGHPDKERCNSVEEISTWCRNQYCPNSNHVDCQSSCERVNAVSATAGLSWSWKP